MPEPLSDSMIRVPVTHTRLAHVIRHAWIIALVFSAVNQNLSVRDPRVLRDVLGDRHF